MHAPHDVHWHTVKTILRYIKGTNFGLQLYHYDPSSSLAYCDAYWTGCPHT